MIAYSEKFELIQWIEKLNDKSIFDELKHIKNKSIESAPDWWNEISISERESIERGLADIANGKVHPHSEVKKIYEEWV